jgi:hypothetical protein
LSYSSRRREREQQRREVEEREAALVSHMTHSESLFKHVSLGLTKSCSHRFQKMLLTSADQWLGLVKDTITQWLIWL